MGKFNFQARNDRGSATRVFSKVCVENRGLILAPQSGHVSNFCSLKRGPLEPVQFLSGQWRTRKTGTLIQTGCPAEILLERLRTSMFE